MTNSESLSIVIPVRNEQDSIVSLSKNTIAAMSSLQNFPFEILFVNDHSTDQTSDNIEYVCKQHSHIRHIHMRSKKGKDNALLEGFLHSRGSLIATIDGDGQNPPHDLIHLIDRIKNYDIICGFRSHRKDRALTHLFSYIANRYRNCITKESIRDAGCAIKIFKRQWIPYIRALTPFYWGNAHYFYPTIIKTVGGTVRQVPVSHKRRIHDSSKFTNHFLRLISGLYACHLTQWYLKRITKI